MVGAGPGITVGADHGTEVTIPITADIPTVVTIHTMAYQLTTTSRQRSHSNLKKLTRNKNDGSHIQKKRADNQPVFSCL